MRIFNLLFAGFGAAQRRNFYVRHARFFTQVLVARDPGHCQGRQLVFHVVFAYDVRPILLQQLA
jgi:hypothetical protein